QLRLKCADKLMSRLTHLDQQVRDMLIFARGETRLAEKMTVSDLLVHLQQAVETNLSRAGAECSWVNLTKDAQVLCNKEALIGALQNLLQNGIEASIGTPRLLVSAAVKSHDSVTIEIADQGAGFVA